MIGLISTGTNRSVMARANGAAAVQWISSVGAFESPFKPHFRILVVIAKSTAFAAVQTNSKPEFRMRNHHRYKHAEDEDDQVLALNNYAEGFLVKQGARIKNWKRRYFVFRDGYISYRKDQRENSRVLGTDVVIDVFYWSGAEFGLALKLSSGRVLNVSPTSEQQACVWYEVVQGYVMRQQMIRQLQHVDRQRQKHLEPIWETENAAEHSAELIQYNLLR